MFPPDRSPALLGGSLVWLGVCLAAGVGAPRGLAGQDRTATGKGIDFNRDVRPILSDRCFQCHGPDEKQRRAGLRLDLQRTSRALRDGRAAIVAGDPSSSELIRRVTHPDPDERMPPAETGRVLGREEIDVLRRWIAGGAQYAEHWAFIPPRRPSLPPVDARSRFRNPIDLFVLARLEKEGLSLSPEAAPETLIRRAHFDLTGLPPTVEEIDAFLADRSPDAYERRIDRLLSSPAYGEHRAVAWLDAARYADTNGYNNDTPRFQWRWRDWVVESYNADLPFDRFATEQLAGDLLPGASISQQLATGFNRNHNITSEGGIIDEEYRLEYVADRVQTVATVFLALTMRCARCHDHKFDPISQKEYYRFFAYFNQVPEKGYDGRHGNARPVIEVPTREQSEDLEGIARERARLNSLIEERRRLGVAALADWEKRLPPERREEAPLPAGLLAHWPLDEGRGETVLDAVASAPGAVRGVARWVAGKTGAALDLDGSSHVELGDAVRLERDRAFSCGAWVFPLESRPMNILSRMDDRQGYRGFDLTFEGGPVSVHMIHRSPGNELKVQTRESVALNRWTHVFATHDGSGKAAGVKIYFDGAPQKLDIHHDGLTDTIQTAVPLRIARRSPGIPFRGKIDEVRFYDRRLRADEVARLVKVDPLPRVLGIAAERRSEEEREIVLARYLAEEDPEYRRRVAELDALSARQEAIRKSIPTAMVMRDRDEARDTFVLRRGEYDKPGEKVRPGVPAIFPPLPGESPPDRRGLARWLTAPDHPLTARVAVNRLWYEVFGLGIVETLEDFGSQGAWPSHPELLDWLATEFVRTGWDVKKMLRLMLTSATYRQSSRATEKLARVDPRNRLLTRGPRFRLSAEMIRDSALAVSGLLQHRQGGPSVRPYQPPGLWVEVSVADDSYSGGPYKQDRGPNLYRRSVYTYWKRTCPPSSLSALDAPEREFCTVQRSRTNTPLQALVLLNDPTYVEAARVLAERLLVEGGGSTSSRIAFAFRRATARVPRAIEIAVLERAYRGALRQYRRDREAAAKLVAVGDSTVREGLDVVELAAWTTVTGMILNLDETITKG